MTPGLLHAVYLTPPHGISQVNVVWEALQVTSLTSPARSSLTWRDSRVNKATQGNKASPGPEVRSGTVSHHILPLIVSFHSLLQLPSSPSLLLLRFQGFPRCSGVQRGPRSSRGPKRWEGFPGHSGGTGTSGTEGIPGTDGKSRDQWLWGDVWKHGEQSHLFISLHCVDFYASGPEHTKQTTYQTMLFFCFIKNHGHIFSYTHHCHYTN